MNPAPASSKGDSARFLRLFGWILAFTLLLAGTTSAVVVLDVGEWLVREDPLQRATAIAVLSGNFPARALEAARLYHDGYAEEIWLTHPGVRADALRALGLSYPSEDDFNVRVLRLQGVPPEAIHVLNHSIVNTAEELDVISTELKSSGGEKIIIVTNKAHTRRVRMLWKKYFAGRGTAVVHAVSDDDFEAGHWWRTSANLQQVVHEVLGIVNTWANMPVQPGPYVTNAAVASETGSDQSGTD